MQPLKVKITFQPYGRQAYVLPGTSLLEAAAEANLILQSPCGGRGICGKCRVRVVSGTTSVTPDADGGVLACQTRVVGPAEIEISEESLFSGKQNILTGDSGVQGELRPFIQKHYLELPLPSRDDPASDVERVRRAIGPLTVGPEVLRELPGCLRRNEWKLTAVTTEQTLLALDPGDTTQRLFGAAFDIGSTTLVGTLIDLRDGREVAVVSRLNPQVPYGDDVLSRILRIRERPTGLAELHSCLVEALNLMLTEMAASGGARIDEIYEVSFAGNSTMQQTLCGLDSSALGEIPFVEVFSEGQSFPASAVGLRIHPAGQVYVFPQIGGFVGGDTVACMVASRLDRSDRPVLLVDIGTNGELVLSYEGRLLATSTAAGPAFEGARIQQGMRATAGAIEKVLFNDDVRISVIGHARPIGLCGTALIDTAAWMLRVGLLDESGRICSPDEVPAGVAPALAARVFREKGQNHFRLVTEEESGLGEAIVLWQEDVRELQLATGAIRAGIDILLRRANLAPDDLAAVYLAGGFGNFIRRSNARRIGLLPQIPCDRIRFIGNAASLGGKLALLSTGERLYAEQLQRQSKHVDLSLDPDFHSAFGDALWFPSQDVEPCDCER